MQKRVVIKTFKIKALATREKKIRVILPDNYDISEEHYPVLYMHDGQNLVDKAFYSQHSWGVMDTMDNLAETEGRMIIVGIDNDEKKRILEYSPVINSRLRKALVHRFNVPADEIKAEADQYGDFIINQVIPYINKTYRTMPDRDNTYLAGSSCGGVISIYLGLKYQDVFSVIGAFSPAYWTVNPELFRMIQKTEFRADTWIYHDMGGKEEGGRKYLRDQNKYDTIMRKKLPSDQIMRVMDPEAKHSEEYWEERFPLFYHFCMKHGRTEKEM